MGYLPFGDFMRASRTAKKVSQRQLSLNAGLSGSYVGKVENGEIEPSFRAFALLVRELGFTKAEIVHLVQQEGLRAVCAPGHDRQDGSSHG